MIDFAHAKEQKPKNAHIIHFSHHTQFMSFIWKGYDHIQLTQTSWYFTA